MSYAELGSCFHDAGGGYLWVKEGLPKWNGFLSGWMSWFAHAVACSLYALGFGAYFDRVLAELGLALPHVGFISPQKLIALSVALLFGFILQGVVEWARQSDLVVMGGRSASFFGLPFGQSLTREITARSACPVLWVKEYEENPSFWSGLVSRRAPEDEGRHG
jgi:hypothetical protein